MREVPNTPEYQNYLRRQAERAKQRAEAENLVRGTGRTTRQMESLPLNGVFISCCHPTVIYDKQLARRLERADIQVYPPSWLTNMSWQGRSYSAIEVDHYYHLMNHKNNDLFYHCLTEARTRIRP